MWKVSFLPKASDEAKNHRDRCADRVSLCQDSESHDLWSALARLDANRILRLEEERRESRARESFLLRNRKGGGGGKEGGKSCKVACKNIIQYRWGRAADSFLISMKIAFGDFDDNAIPVF